MKIVISIIIIAALGFLGWEIWQYSQKFNSGKPEAQQEEAAVNSVDPTQLPGMPPTWEEGYRKAATAATNGDIGALRTWLRNYGQKIDDPRRAWIEMDYMVMISRDNPQEARAIFDSVKERTPKDSPVYPRVKELEKTYQ
jgi:hypothetical protein